MLVNLCQSPKISPADKILCKKRPGAAQLRWQHEQSSGAVDGKSRSIGVVAPVVTSFFIGPIGLEIGFSMFFMYLWIIRKIAWGNGSPRSDGIWCIWLMVCWFSGSSRVSRDEVTFWRNLAKMSRIRASTGSTATRDPQPTELLRSGRIQAENAS